jgi:sugar O-acyltransferase (sialic acid O-acetyltransferase NeuD family)
MIIREVTVPLLNANEPEAQLIEIHVFEGQSVKKGDILFSLETTKATADIDSPSTGFVRIQVSQGETVSVGMLLAVITETVDEVVEINSKKNLEGNSSPLRITQPARELAIRSGVDLASLPTDRLFTESMIRDMIRTIPRELPVALAIEPERSILIYGGGGHAKTVIDLVKSIGSYSIIGIIDDNIPPGTLIMGIPVLGSREILPELGRRGLNLAANGVGGILDIKIRVALFELLDRQGFSFPKLIHPRAWIEESAVVQEGVQIFSNAYVGSESLLQSRCLINTSAVVSHDCTIGAYSHIAPGALLAGQVQIGKNTLIGMGVTIAIGIKIGDNVRIGNGAIIYADVPARAIIPAGKIWSGYMND